MESRTTKENELGLYIPQICPEAPATGSAFCEDHCQALMAQEFKEIGLRDFIKYCGGNPNKYSKVGSNQKVNFV